MNIEKKRQYYNQYMKHYYTYTAKGRYHRLKENAKKQGFSFNMNQELFIKWYESQSLNCYYCGVNLTIGIWKQHKLTDLTFDRKDNTRGYELDNIVLACRRCNLMKGDWLTEQQTLEIAGKYFRG